MAEEINKIKSLLEKIKKPRIISEDRIEEKVGDSVSDAYDYGLYDGEKLGKYKLAQKILKLLEK